MQAMSYLSRVLPDLLNWFFLNLLGGFPVGIQLGVEYLSGTLAFPASVPIRELIFFSLVISASTINSIWQVRQSSSVFVMIWVSIFLVIISSVLYGLVFPGKMFSGPDVIYRLAVVSIVLPLLAGISGVTAILLARNTLERVEVESVSLEREVGKAPDRT